MTPLLGSIGLSGPPEGRVFGFLGAFGIVVAVVYWFVSYEAAGTVLLGAFGAVTALIGLGVARATAGRSRTPAIPRPPDEATDERPLQDESGRIPSPTLAPFAVGVGLSIAATALVFGPAPLLVGAPPALWGFVTWLHRAVAEMRAVEREEPAGPR
ncbi:MAG TPA: cytochrome c oxidase subunit 4 [Candidatus Limnocylindrales bacterium]|nr:cytochrome c oxidase subunit 4 [Candidatus Limnocylindrales bacterium]